jgi:hypothetical protein
MVTSTHNIARRVSLVRKVWISVTVVSVAGWLLAAYGVYSESVLVSSCGIGIAFLAICIQHIVRARYIILRNISCQGANMCVRCHYLLSVEDTICSECGHHVERDTHR